MNFLPLQKKLFFVACAVLCAGFFVFSEVAQAAPSPAVFSASGKVVQQLLKISAGSTVDVAQDAIVAASEGSTQPENIFVVGSPEGTRPTVLLLNADGSRKSKFEITSVSGNPKVIVAVGNVFNAEQQSIVTAFGKGFGPQIRIYDLQGNLKKSFYAFGKGGYKGGVSLSLGDVTGDGIDEIIVGTASGDQSQVFVFSGAGTLLKSFNAYGYKVKNGIALQAGDVTGDGIDEIATTTQQSSAHVKIFSGEGSLLSAFKISKTATAISIHEPTQEIVLAQQSGSKASIMSYSAKGKSGSINFTPFGSYGTASLAVASTDATDEPEIIAAPQIKVDSSGIHQSGKVIVVHINEQRMYRYENGTLVGSHIVSTGKWSMPTPLGTFAIRNKMTTAYSRPYHLYMDNWMAFTADGKYGIHSLPYWKLAGGKVVYEGVNHLGIRVSHGCIRLSPAESRELFLWATVGTTVKVVN